MTRKLFPTLILLMLFGCTDSVNKNNSQSAKESLAYSFLKGDTSQKTILTLPHDTEPNQISGEDQDRIDTSRFLKALQMALVYANRNKHRNSFRHQFELKPDDSASGVTTQIKYGQLFERERKHLLIRRTNYFGIICDVFLFEKGNFKRMLQWKESGMTYHDYSLSDVNGDGHKDFLAHWYPTSGCCRRNVYNVYLYEPLTGAFTSDFEFINPTFFPKEKIIRGIDYGHPGEVGLYKYRWNGHKVDTIEFVHPLKNHKKGRFLKTRRRTDEGKDGIVLHALPVEYRHIESIEWFLNY